MRSYSREINKNEMESVFIKDIIKDVIELCINAKILNNKVIISGNFLKCNYRIFCIKNQISQVFQNLITNSVQAMDEKGEIIIDIFKNNSYMVIYFSDNGPGVSENLKNKIFDPFFTTKGTKGTGLGLYITYNIIKKHKGEIELFNNGKGLAFKIQLPMIINDN